MKTNLLLITALLMSFAAPLAMAEGTTPAGNVTGMDDGVGAGGSGGNPNASVGTMSLLGSPNESDETGSSRVTTTSLRKPTTTIIAPKGKETVVTVPREELLKAVDAALNSTDIEMEVDQEPVTIRLQKFDLNRGILHGQVLETKNTIRLIDEAKAKK